MSDATEQRVSQHYARPDLERAILAALVASGKSPDQLTPDDLSPVDEFHTGGRQATIELAAQMAIEPDMHLLDIGCGIGGPSRYFAQAHRCRVTGIDLTEDYARTAAALALRVGLGERVRYRQASALALPFRPETFDGAFMMHVGMNIENKHVLFTEVRRVLKNGRQFAIYDIMRAGSGDLSFPVHWAATSESSFVVSPADYRKALQAAGFEIVHERDRSAFAREAFAKAKASAAASGEAPPLGIHILMKTDVALKLDNVIKNLALGLIAPVELICRAG